MLPGDKEGHFRFLHACARGLYHTSVGNPAYSPKLGVQLTPRDPQRPWIWDTSSCHWVASTPNAVQSGRGWEKESGCGCLLWFQPVTHRMWGGELCACVWESWLGRGKEFQCLTPSFPWNMYQCHSWKLLEIATIIWLAGQCYLVFIPDNYYHVPPSSSSAQRLPTALGLPYRKRWVIILSWQWDTYSGAANALKVRCCSYSFCTVLKDTTNRQ